MDKYTFNSSGTELLELMAIVVNITTSMPGGRDFFFDERYSFLACQSDILSSRIYSKEEDFVKMANRLVHREPNIIHDAQKIVNLFQNTNDLEGQKVLFNILKGIDKRKIASGVKGYNIERLYNEFLYNKGHAGLRVNVPEINKFLLIKLLESEHPEAKDFRMLVDNAESFGVSDEDIEKIYKMLKYNYESEGTYVNGKLMRENDLERIQKTFAPVQERLEVKKQQAQQAQSAQTSEEYEPKTLEEALALIRQLREENGNLKKRNAVLDGIIKASQLQNQGGRNNYVPPELVRTI